MSGTQNVTARFSSCEPPPGCELRPAATGKGTGVFATKPFAAGEMVVPGVAGRPVSANDAYPNQVGIDEWVVEDGFPTALNHSCDPNCGVKQNAGGAYDFYALRPIAVGVEITWDYATRNYTINHFPAVCLCGSRNCRGSITGWKDMTAEQKAAYTGFVAQYLLELDARAG